MATGFWPVFDGDVLPGDQYLLYQQGRFNDTPVTTSGHPAQRTAWRPMQALCSPACWTSSSRPTSRSASSCRVDALTTAPRESARLLPRVTLMANL